MIRLTAPLSIVLCGVAAAQSDAWPRFRGPANTDHSPDTGLLKEWPEGGPKRLWLYEDAGEGYSGFSVGGDRLYTMGTRDEKCILICLEAATGKEVWTTPLGEVYPNRWGGGPRSTPTLDGARVYAVGGHGDIICCERKDGKKVWSRKMSEFGGKVPQWGYSESLLVDGDRVICACGGKKGALVALDKKTGKEIWQSEGFSGLAEYSSVVVADIGGTRQYIRLLQKVIGGIDAATGKVLWTHEWSVGRTAVIPTPIVDKDKVYVTSGYGAGSMLLQVGKSGAEAVWQNKVMKNHHGGVVRVGDHLYGHADTGWVCQKWEDGTEVWREREALGKGAVHYADGMLYCLEENTGTVALVKATPAGYEEASRFTLKPQAKNRARAGKIWVHPVVVDGRLFLRDQEYVYCHDVRGGGESPQPPRRY